MHLALDLTQELVDLSAKIEKPVFRTIMTTSLKDDGLDDSFKLVKKAFMGDNKALIIKLNEDVRMKSKCKANLKL